VRYLVGDNVKAFEVTRNAEELALLDNKTKPAPGIPANMQAMVPAIHNGAPPSVDLPPVIGELTFNDRGKAVSIVRRSY
jgi:hypothetical protein